MDSITVFYSLFISLVCLTIIFYIIQGLDVLQPNVIVSGTMAFSVFLAAINIDRWNYTITLLTFNSILFGVIAFGLGGLSANYSWLKKEYYKNEFIRYNSMILYSNNYFIFGVVVLLGALALHNWNSVIEISRRFGSNGEYSNVFKILRYAIENELVEYPTRSMVYANYIAQTIGFCYLYLFVRTVITRGIRLLTLKLLLPVCMYIPFIVMTTGRIMVLGLVTYTLTISIILFYQKHAFDIRCRVKALYMLLISGFLFVTLFLALGSFTGKTITAERTPIVIISHYAGLSIPALDVWLNDVWIETQYIGVYTLNNVYRILMRLGVDLPRVDIFLPFTKFNGINTNVYTAMGRYIRDFGYLGMLCLMYIMGLVYTWIYQFICHNRHPFIIMLYGAISYPIFLMSIEERFFIDLFGMPLVYMIVFLYLSYRLVFYSKCGD